MDETGGTNPSHVVESVHTYGTSLDRVGTDPKGKHGYPGDGASGGHVEGDEGGDRYPD